MEITTTFSISDSELNFTFIRASGPGGQNVNKVATGVQLRFDVWNSPSLSEEVKNRLGKLAGSKMTQEGILVIEAKRYRSQEQNRFDAKQRLVILIQNALIKPRKRWPTHPTAASQQRRVESKKKRAGIKLLRQEKGNSD